MKGDLSDLAAPPGRDRRTSPPSAHGAARLIVCPSYYTDDPVLDRVFGQRPAGLPATTWAPRSTRRSRSCGPARRSAAANISPGHLARVTEELGRKPFLWDNYPVNDGPRMSRHLHLRAFTGRPAAIARPPRRPRGEPGLAADAQRHPDAHPGRQLRAGRRTTPTAGVPRRPRGRSAARTSPPGWSADLLTLQDGGLDELSDERRRKLRARYAAFDHPAAREVVAWLDGAYAVTGEELQTQ